MAKLVLVDGNAIMHRAFHALPASLTDYDNEPINAVYGLVSMLLRVIQDLSPTHVAFAFDRPEPTFRKEVLPEYQAHRPEMDQGLAGQFPKAQKVIEAMGVPMYSKSGFEADDVIGTLAKAAYDNFEEVVIITGDRDILQLVNGKVRLYMPVKGLSEGKLFGREETVERMGVPPEQIVDFKALVGDPSDNYKGVPGIGPKTASVLLSEYGTLDNIYKNMNKLPVSVKSKLEDNRKSAYQSQHLAQIVTDVDIDYNLDDCAKWQVDDNRVLTAFGELGFKTLARRVKELGKQIVSENQLKLM